VQHTVYIQCNLSVSSAILETIKMYGISSTVPATNRLSVGWSIRLYQGDSHPTDFRGISYYGFLLIFVDTSFLVKLVQKQRTIDLLTWMACRHGWSLSWGHALRH